MVGENTITVGVERKMNFEMNLTQNEFGVWNAKLSGPTVVDSEMFKLLKPNVETALGNLSAQGKIGNEDVSRLMKDLRTQATAVDTEREKLKMK